MPNFNVTPDNPEQVEIALSVIALAGNSQCYLSTPITGGQRWLNWDGDPETKKSQVIDPNIAAAKRILTNLPSPKVIDPTVLEVPGWTQNDYRYFFGEVVKRHASGLVMADGWQVSIGCVYEYLCARQHRLQVLDSRLHEIAPDSAWFMVANGIRQVERQKRDATQLKLLLLDMENLK